ncbi:hypothetical protein D3C80_1113640 [compost metagenome]
MGALILDLRSVRRQADPGEHPALMGIVEVAIAGPRMTLGRGEGPAAQDHLIGHELAVVFRRSPLGRTEPRIGGIGAGRPLPDLARQVGEGRRVTPRRLFPFRLGRQPPPRPSGKGVGLIEADMTHRRRRIDGAPPAQGHGAPSRRLFAPVEGRRPAFRPHPRPTVRQPELGPPIAVVIDKGDPVLVGDQIRRQRKGLQPDPVRRPLVVEGEAVAVCADLR